MKPQSTPKAKVIHRAKYVAPNGDVSALCFDKPRAIDLSKATWTNRPVAVTCKKCLQRQDLSIDKAALAPQEDA